MTIVGRFVIEVRAETEADLRRQFRVIRGAVIAADKEHGVRCGMTAPELTENDATNFHTGSYCRTERIQLPNGMAPPSSAYWRR